MIVCILSMYVIPESRFVIRNGRLEPFQFVAVHLHLSIFALQSQVTPARNSSRGSWEEMTDHVESFSCEIHSKHPRKGLMPLCPAYQNVG